MSHLLLEVPDQKSNPEQTPQVLVEVDTVPCEPTDTACTRRWIDVQSDCV